MGRALAAFLFGSPFPQVSWAMACQGSRAAAALAGPLLTVQGGKEVSSSQVPSTNETWLLMRKTVGASFVPGV